MTEKNPETTKQIKDFSAGMKVGILALGNELAKDGVTRGLHSTYPLPAGTKDSFGTFTNRWAYVEGCVLSEELGKSGVGEVTIITQSATGEKITTGIGKTPSEYDPAQGGQPIADAGDPGAYLMFIHRPDGQKFRYLDELDLQGARIEIGADSTRLGENTGRQRQIEIPGTVQQVDAFLS